MEDYNNVKVHLLNKEIILTLNLCITSYLILAAIVESERKYRTLINGTYFRYSELKGLQIAKNLLVHPSTVSYHLKKLINKEYVIKTKFGYCISDNVEELFSKQIATDLIGLSMHPELAKFCKTPEQVLVATFLWNEFYLKNRKINKTDISKDLSIDRKTIYNIINDFENRQILRIWKKKVCFLNEAKGIFLNVIEK